jgi:periplasmic protein TonB
MRKALIVSLICHVAFTIGICQWKTLQSVVDNPREIYEVELVDGAHAENSVASAKVEPAVLTPVGPRDATTTMQMPSTTVEPNQPKPERDLSALLKARDFQPRAPKTDSPQEGHAPAVAPAKGSRFAIDAPPGEALSEPIGDLEARGSVMQPLHVTHPGPYTENYVLLNSVKPVYPQHERDLGIEGSVTVELLVDTVGNVAHADVLQLVGPESFSRAVLDAVRQFTFQPPVENGEPSTMWIKFVYTFHMNS